MQSKRLHLTSQRYFPFFLEIVEFIKSLSSYVGKRLGRAFIRFEGAKGVIVSGLYRRRGKYAQPFVHSAMAGLIFVSVTFGPLFIAQTFPGQAASFDDDLPSEVVLATSSDSDPAIVTYISEKPRSEVVDYEVQPGDTVSSIAEKFGVTVDTVLWANNMDEKDRIKPGQTLKIPPVAGIVHTVKKGDTIYSIAKKYEAESQAIVDFPFNTFTNDETFALAVGQTIIVPDGIKPDVKPVSPVTGLARILTPDAGVVSATGQFVWPAAGRISQRFVWYHKGIDIANKGGGSILAADAGQVVLAGWPDNQGYGNRVIVDHGNGYQTLYAHLSRISVSVGQTVNPGDVLGQMGCTGRCTGTHLHFEIIQNGVRVNPLNFLK
jgi:murein DD-endopeptidase MepM/ murein hydrolase activator NlpD